jgi:hypothetical protein
MAVGEIADAAGWLVRRSLKLIYLQLETKDHSTVSRFPDALELEPGQAGYAKTTQGLKIRNPGNLSEISMCIVQG